MLQAIPVRAFRDNYIWLLPLPGDVSGNRVAIVDPGDATPVIARLEALGLEPAAILVTHHHYDHIQGIPALLEYRAVPVYGPAASPARGIDHPVRDGDRVVLDGLGLEVLAVPGHTLDHIAYYTPGLLMCGDTLFAGGCGRLFEGTPEQMFASLQRIAQLPDETLFFCAHEYTVPNLEFACEVEPRNEAIRARLEACRRLRARDAPTLPATLAEERRTNPFLRCREAAVIDAAERLAGGRGPMQPHEVFAAIRRWKDRY